jgi:alkylhydroperoxidase/carboxymuconolactone decarboxylase family protein YurZ
VRGGLRTLLDGLWKRAEMSARDRSIVTVAALIARIETFEMPFHFALTLDKGVKPSELSEIITHLANRKEPLEPLPSLSKQWQFHPFLA